MSSPSKMEEEERPPSCSSSLSPSTSFQVPPPTDLSPILRTSGERQESTKDEINPNGSGFDASPVDEKRPKLDVDVSQQKQQTSTSSSPITNLPQMSQKKQHRLLSGMAFFLQKFKGGSSSSANTDETTAANVKGQEGQQINEAESQQQPQQIKNDNGADVDPDEKSQVAIYTEQIISSTIISTNTTDKTNEEESSLERKGVNLLNDELRFKKFKEKRENIEQEKKTRIRRPDVYLFDSDSGPESLLNCKWQTLSECYRQNTTPNFRFSSKIRENNYVRSCKWSTDGRWLVTDSEDRIVRVFSYDPESFELSPFNKLPHGGLVHDIQWHPSQTLFGSTAKDQPIHVWDVNGGLKASFRGINNVDELSSAYSLCFSLNGDQVLAGYLNYFRVFDMNRPGKQISEIKTFTRDGMANQKGILSTVIANPAMFGSYAAGSFCGTVAFYSPDQAGCHCLFEAKTGITHMQYSSDGMHIYVGYRKINKIDCFDIRYLNKPMKDFFRPARTNQRIYFEVDPYERYLYTGSSVGFVQIYDCEAINRADRKVWASPSAVTGLSLHPTDGLLLAVTTGQRVFPTPLSPKFDDSSDSDSNEEMVTRESKENLFPSTGSSFAKGEYAFCEDQAMLDNALKLIRFSAASPLSDSEDEMEHEKSPPDQGQEAKPTD